jgi:hypothetical protein
MWAQQHTVTGTVRGENNLPVQHANIAALRADSSMLGGTSTDSLSNYRLVTASFPRYLRCSFVGYQTSFVVLDTDSVSFSHKRDIVLKPSSGRLGEVVVLGDKPLFDMKDGEITANVSRSVLRNEIDMFDLLGKIPLVMVNGKSIDVANKGAPVYYLNNRPVSDFSEVENLMVDQVESITVMTTPSVRYQSNGRPVILIRTKNPQDGWSVVTRLNATQKHKLGHSEQMNLSYQRGILNLYGGYRYTDDNSKSVGSSDVRYLTDTIWNFKNGDRQYGNSSAHWFNAGMGLTWQKHSAGLKYTGQHTKSGSFSNSDRNVTNSQDASSFLLRTLNDGRSRLNRHTVSLYYNGEWSKRLSFSLYADYVRQGSDNTGVFNEHDSATGDRTVNSSTTTSWNIYSVNASLQYKPFEASRFTVGGKFSWVDGYNQVRNTQALDNGKTINRERKQSVFGMYDLRLGDFALNAGLTAMRWYPNIRNLQANSQLRDSYTDLYPSVRLSHSRGMFQQSLSYSFQRERPLFNQLNDNSVYTNRFNIAKGNSSLLPSSTHSVDYSLYWNGLMAYLSYGHTTDYIFLNSYVDDRNSMVAINQYVNYPSVDELRASLYYQRTIRKWTSIVGVTLIRSFFSYKGPDGISLRSKSPIASFYLSGSLQLPKDFYLSGTFDYQTKGDYLNIKSGSNMRLNLQLQKSLFKKKLQISLNAYDIFHQYKNNGAATFNNVMTNTKSASDTRRVGITITYRLERKHRTPPEKNSAEDEIRRLQE